MAYVKTYLPTLKTHVVNLKRDAKDLSRDSQRLEVRGKLGSKTLYCYKLGAAGIHPVQFHTREARRGTQNFHPVGALESDFSLPRTPADQ